MITSLEREAVNLGLALRMRSFRRLKTLIWLYLFLLIFEGAVRKWIPPLATPFLVVRDPIALAIWFYAARLRIGSRRTWTFFYCYALVITTLGLMQIIGNSLSPLIVLYGWRSYVLHIPVIIVLAAALEFEDLRKIGWWGMLISLPMTLLMAMQYLAPPEALLNRGASENAGQITGALGHIRPAGTFSFISGPIGFVPLVAIACLWGLSRKGLFPRWLVIGASIATVIAIPVSVSRTVALTVGAVLITTLIGAMVRGGMAFSPKRLPQIAASIIIAVLVLAGVSYLPLVQDAMNTFATRWTQAQGEAGDNSDLEERVFQMFTGALYPLQQVSVLGTGIGTGSTVAAALRGDTLSGFQYGEGSLQREMFELGSWLGALFVLARFLLAGFLVVALFRALILGAFLPWLLLVPATLNLVQGSLDQTTGQGFLVVSLGICLAALKLGRNSES